MNILFLCVQNSARSQIAEGLAKKIFGSGHWFESAGSEPSGTVRPWALEVLQEKGIDTKGLSSKSWDALQARFLENLDYVITLCTEEICPVMLTKATRLHWPIPDPVSQTGDELSTKEAFVRARDEIEAKLLAFKKTVSNPS